LASGRGRGAALEKLLLVEVNRLDATAHGGEPVEVFTFQLKALTACRRKPADALWRSDDEPALLTVPPG